jgi:hypothetical protein
MKTIRRYYLPLFVGSLLFLSVKTFTTPSPNRIAVNVLICIAGALVMSAILGTLYYMLDTKWGPAKRKKILLKSPFTELFKNGFQKMGEVAVGQVNGFTVLVFYTWQAGGRPVIKLDILFDIGFHVHPENDVLKVIVNRNPPTNRFSSLAHEWTKNSIGCRFEYYIKPPAWQKLTAKAEELTEILLREGLEPMSIEKARELKKQVN